MFDVTTFLMRWMFLSNILRNVAEIQTFPQQHLPYDAHHHPEPPRHQQQHPHPLDILHQEDRWRNHCLQTILSYPPGGQRLLMVDAYRVELIHKMDVMISRVHEFLKYRRESSSMRKRIGWHGGIESSRNSNADSPIDGDTSSPTQQQPSIHATTGENAIPGDAQPLEQNHEDPPDAEYSGSQTAFGDPQHLESAHESQLSGNQVHGEMIMPDITLSLARKRLKQLRESLPQLVAAVLKSPPPVNPSLVDPVHAFRQLLIKRCAQDPSWGIELCWLLEADVGRAWKAVLEHPQRTGRRLVFILPAEKAAVLAQIGHEKREAFDLLQDAEEATAYGFTAPTESSFWNEGTITDQLRDMSSEGRLPSSLSQRRCAHFGDTMHFIDRLTKLSLDLRRVPTLDRLTHLKEGLKEMNRRIRRRMVTKGELSLDIEDNYGPEDWPRIDDLKTDMLQHSVHFPFVPQSGAWPTGGDDKRTLPQEYLGVVRVLNIVVEESRLLSSRERCPFLVQLEVADTGFEGDDARLYTSGANSVGSTVEEALSMNQMHNSELPQQQLHENQGKDTNVGYSIPHELLPPNTLSQEPSSGMPLSGHELPRGGSISTPDQPYSYDGEALDHEHAPYHSSNNYNQQQYHYREPSSYHDPAAYQDENVAYGLSYPSGAIQQHELEALHHQLHFQQQQQALYQQQQHAANYNTIESAPKAILTGKALLDEVFGEPWSEKCKAIKESSPFGQVDGWRLASFIMKAGEDIRKESLVMQVISKMRAWFEEEIEQPFRPIMRPYTIMCVGGDAGLVECLSDAKSVDEVKKKTENFESLVDFFVRAFGPPGSIPSDQHRITFEKAQDNFLRSLVGYSLVCYVLQIKDRHNANILMDREGHVMHIDFGFVLGDTPKMGKVPIFSERAPFKLSAEYWDVLGGWNTRAGGLGVKFCKMFEKAFACASKHAEEIATMVETSVLGLNFDPRAARVMANGVRSRLRMRGPPGSQQQKLFVVELVSAARASWGTSTYDWLQKNMNGYQ